MSIDVVIVNWNSGEQLGDCVHSLQGDIAEQRLQVVVVDNGSTDGSNLGVEGPRVEVINTGKNLGFGSACNLGAKKGHQPYILFLNPDAKVYPHTLSYLIDYMNDPQHANVGVCGVQLEDEAGEIARSCTRLPTWKSMLAHSLGIDRVWPRAGFFMGEWAHDDTRSVGHVIGAFYLIRRSVFEEMGGFDERFFVYLEDLDLSKRVNECGSDIRFIAHVQAFHKGGGTSEQVKARRLFYSLRSRILYAFKHYSVWGAILLCITTLVLEPVLRGLQALLKRRGLGETLSAYKLLYGWLIAWIIKGTTR